MIAEGTPPGKRGRHFYAVKDNEDGTVDVYLRPEVYPKATQDGATDYDILVKVVKNVAAFDGLEDDIRARYEAWCESAESIYL